MSTKSTRSAYAKWAAPVIGIAVGIVYLIVMSLRGDPLIGLVMLGIMLAYTAIVIALSTRTEAGALLRGNADDERQRQIGLRSVAVTGEVLIMVVLGGMMYTLATGSSAIAIWAGVAAVGGATFIGATVVLSRWG